MGRGRGLWTAATLPSPPRPFLVRLHFSDASQGVPHTLLCSPEVRARCRCWGGPRTLCSPGWHPQLCLPTLGRRLLAACLAPMESLKPTPGPLCPRALRPPLLHYLFALLSGKHCDPCPQLDRGRGLRTPLQAPCWPRPGPACVLAAHVTVFSSSVVALLRDRDPQGRVDDLWVFCREGGTCRCSINIHSLMTEMLA